MTRTLTPRQQNVYDFIIKTMNELGYPPTRAEIARALGFRSPNAAEEHLRALSRKGVMGDWYVVPGSRGRGVGRRLFEALLGIFREAGCSQVETSTWPFNTATRRVMEELGFREIQITYRAPIDAFDGD